jgi:hypothetical protein
MHERPLPIATCAPATAPQSRLTSDEVSKLELALGAKAQVVVKALQAAGLVGAAKQAAKEGRGAVSSARLSEIPHSFLGVPSPANSRNAPMNKQQAELINFASAWLDRRVANMEEEIKQL